MLLTRGIAKRILLNVGASFILKDRVGLFDPNLLSQKKVKILYDNSINIEHKIYVGKLHLGESILRGLLVNLSLDNVYEFLFLFQMDSSPIYAVRVSDDDDANNYIKSWNGKLEKWSNTSVQMQASLLVNFEKIVSWGFMWRPAKDIDDLYKLCLTLI